MIDNKDLNNREFDFEEIVKHFRMPKGFIGAKRYGFGHINDTFTVNFDNGVRYILQRVNNVLFKDVPKLMKNISLVTEFNRKMVADRGGDPNREGLTIIYTNDNLPYYFDGKNYFRAYIFIENATTYQVVAKSEHFYESAIAFGNFAKMLARFDATQLYDVLPNFHNTVVRFENFSKVLEKDALGRAAEVAEDINFYLKRKDYCSRLVDLLASGQMPTKVTHNDTKLNNVMIDDFSGKGIAVIDLDTIMAGTICYDFGDSIRFGCNPAAEDEPDLSKVNFRLDLFEQYVKGYLKALGDSVTKIEKENLAFSAILMTYECGLRFLTDYLEGDTYFKTHRAGQNLDRARTQKKLVEDMEKQLYKMNEIVKSI